MKKVILVYLLLWAVCSFGCKSYRKADRVDFPPPPAAAAVAVEDGQTVPEHESVRCEARPVEKTASPDYEQRCLISGD